MVRKEITLSQNKLAKTELAISDAELQALSEEIPTLALVRRFAHATTQVTWFSEVSRPLSGETRDVAQRYLDTLGFPHVDIAPLRDWIEAGDAAETHGFDTEQFEIEEQLRAGLSETALARMSEQALVIALTYVTANAEPVLRARLEEQAGIWELADEEILNAAAGAALLSAHNAALVLAAGADGNHPLALKYHLFEIGRWPVSITGNSFNLF